MKSLRQKVGVVYFACAKSALPVSFLGGQAHAGGTDSRAPGTIECTAQTIIKSSFNRRASHKSELKLADIGDQAIHIQVAK